MIFLVSVSLEYLPISSDLSAAPKFCTTARGGRGGGRSPSVMGVECFERYLYSGSLRNQPPNFDTFGYLPATSQHC